MPDAGITDHFGLPLFRLTRIPFRALPPSSDCSRLHVDTLAARSTSSLPELDKAFRLIVVSPRRPRGRLAKIDCAILRFMSARCRLCVTTRFTRTQWSFACCRADQLRAVTPLSHSPVPASAAKKLHHQSGHQSRTHLGITDVFVVLVLQQQNRTPT